MSKNTIYVVKSFSHVSGSLEDISEVRVLLIGLVLKSVHKGLVVRITVALRGEPVPLLVLSHQVPAEEENIDDKQRVAAQMGCKCDVVTRCVPR